MTNRPSLDPASPRNPARERLDRLVSRARLTLLWERAWPRLWGPLSVLITFLILSWLGLWLDMAPLGRALGLALFAAAFLASLWPLATMRLPERAPALDRLDRDAGLTHGPARSLEDTLAIGKGDPATQALWRIHRERAEAAIGHLRLAPPSPDMPRRDRFALRAAGLVALVASAFIAGPELWPRIGAAFDWRHPPAAGPGFRVDGWIDPPLYTRTPPLMIDLAAAGGEQRLKAPVNSTVVIRVAGDGDVAITPGPGLTALPQPQNARTDLREQRFTLTGDADLQISTGLLGGVRLQVDAIPDRAPTIALAAPPQTNARGTFELTFRGRDDYGIVSAEGLVEKGENFRGRRSLVEAPKIALPAPGIREGDPDSQTTVDLTNHPWAGAPVKLTLVAKDEAGQEGRSETINFTLPQRPFTKPLAKALVEQRRNLVVDPDDRKRVQTALDALLIAPEVYTPQWGVFMGLRAASNRLRIARSDEQLLEVADLLWQIALQIEEGDLSDAERELRAAQERLREAMERNAPQDEIKRLTDELRQAMNRFLQEFAQRMQEMQRQGQNEDQPPQTAQRFVTPEDFNRMLNEMERMMREGDMAEAQRLLDQLRNILENLQTARPGRMSDPAAREMSRQMNELDRMAREQQQLRDETFQDGQEQRLGRGERRPNGPRQPGRQQQGQRQPGQGQQPGEQPGEGQEPGDQAGEQGLQQRQQALRERLQELQRRMQGMGMRPEQGLGDAEEAMREAEGALGKGEQGEAADAQGRALEGLQRGGQGMAQQMQEMMQGEGNEQAGQPGGQEPGNGMPQGQSQAGDRDTDPLGRPTRGRDFSDGRVRVPTASESAAQRAQRILEELRRKLGDPTRPREELEYFERLLRPR